MIAWDAQDCCITIYDSDALADFVERSGVSKTRLVFLRMLSELGFRLSRGMPDGYSNPAITCVEDMRSVSMTTMQKRQASGTGGRGSEAGEGVAAIVTCKSCIHIMIPLDTDGTTTRSTGLFGVTALRSTL